MALTVIWISVVVGVVLGLWQRLAASTTGPIRTFAVVAAGLVVALSLLPHALLSEGLGGLCAALASVALVPALERLVRIPFRNVNAQGLRLELGYAGLLVHRFGDGLVMAVDGHGRELIWAVGAHEVPIVALVTLAYARRGLAQALARAAVLGLASSLGYWLVRVMPGGWHELHGWIDAVAAGVLIHILAYEALPEQLETPRARALDVLAAAFGLLVIVLPSLDHDGEVPNVGLGLLRSALQAAPPLLVGLLGSAAWLTRQRRARAAAGLVAAARPRPALEAFALLCRWLGWRWMLVYALVASAFATLATTLVRRARGPEPTAGEARLDGYWATLEQLVLRTGGWIILGLLAASYVDSFIAGADALAGVTLPVRAALIAALALVASVASGCAVPLAVALVGKGLSPGLAIAGVALGGVLGNAVEALRQAHMARARAMAWLAPLALAGSGLGLGADALFGAPGPEPISPGTGGHVEWAALGLLVLLIAKSIWPVGIRGWLGSSLRTLSPSPRPEHAHAHVH